MINFLGKFNFTFCDGTSKVLYFWKLSRVHNDEIKVVAHSSPIEVHVKPGTKFYHCVELKCRRSRGGDDVTLSRKSKIQVNCQDKSLWIPWNRNSVMVSIMTHIIQNFGFETQENFKFLALKSLQKGQKRPK